MKTEAEIREAINDLRTAIDSGMLPPEKCDQLCFAWGFLCWVVGEGDPAESGKQLLDMIRRYRVRKES